MKIRYTVDENGCWIWQMALNKSGYGVTWSDGKVKLAHRVEYEKKHGEIETGMVTDHLCRVRPCVNPDHIEIVDRAENVHRGDHGKLTAEQVVVIRKELAAGDQSLSQIGKKYGVSKQAIHNIKCGKTWKQGERHGYGNSQISDCVKSGRCGCGEKSSRKGDE